MTNEPIFISKSYYLKHIKALSKSQGISLMFISLMYGKEFVFLGNYSQEDFDDIENKLGFCKWFLNFDNMEDK